MLGVNDGNGEAFGVEDVAQLKHWVYMALKRTWYKHDPVETSDISSLFHLRFSLTRAHSFSHGSQNCLK